MLPVFHGIHRNGSMKLPWCGSIDQINVISLTYLLPYLFGIFQV
jgi:hypothetical protein